MACAAAGGYAGIVASFKSSGLEPYSKLSAIRRGIRGSGVHVRDYGRLMQDTKGLAGYAATDTIRIGGERPACRLPAQLPLTHSILALFGYYIAEGCAQDRYFILANRHPIIRARIEAALHELGIPFGVRSSSDYQISSTALTTLLAKTCGTGAWDKRLPDFWPQLSDRSLGSCCRHTSTATVPWVAAVKSSPPRQARRWLRIWRSHSNDLVFMRGCVAVQTCDQSNHAGDWYWNIAISGREDLERYESDRIRPSGKGGATPKFFRGRKTDTNVDVVPIRPAALSGTAEVTGAISGRSCGAPDAAGR